MAERPKITKRQANKEPVSDVVSEQAKPSLQQFQLQVDRQTKDSFATLDAAEKAGLTIKQKYPVVRVSIYDAVEGSSKIINLAK